MKNKLTYIIDDDKLTVKLMSILISKNDFCEEIQSFYNAQHAIDKLKQNALEDGFLPDAILLDLNMPFMDGWQFLDEYSTLKPKIKKPIAINIVSSSISPEDVRKARSINAVSDFIIKPITKEKFLKIIQKI